MPERRYIGVRISEQGHRYIHLVAQRDNVNYSEALRRLLALGARTDMETHDPPRNSTANSAHPHHLREAPPATSGERHLPDRNSGEDPHLPDSRPAGSPLGDAIRNIYNGGLNPQKVDPDSAA